MSQKVKDRYIELVAKTNNANPCPGGLPILRRSINCLPNNVLNESIVLDIGTNTGSTLVALAELMQTSNVIGIDISDSMIRQAKDNLERLPDLKNASAQIADIRSLSFPNSYFDLIFSGGTMAFIDDRQKAMEEINRVLKPGGFFVAVEYFYSDKKPSAAVLKKIKDILGFDVSIFTYSYWNKLFHTSDLQLEGVDIQNRSAQGAMSKEDIINKLSVDIKCVEHHKGEFTLNDTDTQFLQNALIAFNENMKYLHLGIFVMRKMGGISIFCGNDN